MALSRDALVLIAGAGWRVWRFIVPALLAAGVAPARIVLWRRSGSAGLHPQLLDLRITTRLDDIRPDDVGITLNCVLAPALVDIQTKLVERFGAAVHFCDTPILADEGAWATVERLGASRVYSLEDWPLTPNLSFFIKEARVARQADLRIAHFGIMTHFLSLYRSIHPGVGREGRDLSTDGSVIAGEPRNGTMVSFWATKSLPISKTFLMADQRVVEDFHEVELQPHGNDEVLYRVVGEGRVGYYRGAEEISSHFMDSATLGSFAPFSDRRNVHELDKAIGLARMFGAVLKGDCSLPYSYMSSARDLIASRQLAALGRCQLT